MGLHCLLNPKSIFREIYNIVWKLYPVTPQYKLLTLLYVALWKIPLFQKD